MAISCCVMARRSFKVSTPPADPGIVITRAVGQGGVNASNDTKLIQTLLNLVAPLSLGSKPPLKVDGFVGPLTIAAIKQFQQASLGLADGRVDPGGKTLARLNVLTFKRGAPPITATSASASGFVGAPPATAPAKMTPLAAAFEATPRALQWTTAGAIQVSALHQGLIASAGVILLPSIFDMINTHFHLDRDPGNIMVNLVKILRIFNRIFQVLSNSTTFYKEGVETDASKFADAPVGGLDFGKGFDRITFRTQYPDCGPMCRSAMLIHEGAHLVGGLNEIGHFSHEFPIPDGEPQDGSPHNYAQMTTSESLRNASSYAAFAINAAFLVDHRFGLDKKAT